LTGPFLERRGQAARVGAVTDALGLIEVSSIARGHVVADAMVKRSPIELVLARPVSPGKHLTLVVGGVDEVKEAMVAGQAAADEVFVDRLELAQVAPQLIAALRGELSAIDDRALGLVETFSVAAALVSADAACKAAEVVLVALRLADGIGGKAYYALQGEQGDVEAGLSAAQALIVGGLLVGTELIARPHESLVTALRDG
jgi:microcompartment protein CcmL/EutN